ncbi:1,4-dihydroxy-2-naphthoate octaprenyltransferase [Algoriphagus alkaliphilus]|uniref:1,4-dihydroxy-2-naphthoate octaprenyltransferase n=1 Tax=Algoriphagus alkaliphilus TaxID=279824 RepID=A0A1G5ZQR8_9BACT|nr:UbiA family prenyltransferase [Algoriphagus alkaliphilus]MBA4299958.1 ubiquinone biosynthesis protein UbiA [Cyclobacterium sp.]SDA97151.1 1,4-dihydroxy-2-naphthoate octaprenyltransferase [Algoriphagus alkaliphilus]
MITRSSVRHLRIPFSLFLLPVFLFALALTPNLNGDRLLLVFLALHLFLYPSSNGYNSFFDRDEESIGGLKHPPKVTPDLYWLSQGFFLISLILGAMISLGFAGMLLVYGLVSMAYSHPRIRIKKYPWASWIIAGFFQGYFTFAMAYAGLSDLGWDVIVKPHVIIPGLLTSLMLWGNYPLTQVYQHREDSKRGDCTLSLKLGIKGTFLFSALFFALTGAAFIWYFLDRGQDQIIWVYLGAMAPIILFFLIWFGFVNQNPEKYASYSWAMGMNSLSALALNAFFIYYFLENTQIQQVFGY